jgi:type I restriction enzyme S subunit
MRAMPIPLPPLQQQEHIVATLAGQMAGAEQVRQALEAQLAAINQLPAALLRRAFRGEL